ncbi:unnamed protein product [Trifolium pratense]|uniref:Uncharacterized protein n=1 Tax=Trifolium pratense TaxID=57577 RepID=A0ACB0KHM4_TRIPR|nr:unnamed protein product [Trifolium pratense]
MPITSQLVLSFCLIQWGVCSYICVGYPLIIDAHNALHKKVLEMVDPRLWR